MKTETLKVFESRKELLETYPYPLKKNDEINSYWFMRPIEHQIADFVKGLGVISYFKTIQNEKQEIMYEIIHDYVLVNNIVHDLECECGECTEQTRAQLYKVDGFDNCYLGVGSSYGENPALIYDYEKIIEQLKNDGMSQEEAEEHFDFNIAGTYFGEKMPIFLNRIPLEDLG